MQLKLLSWDNFLELNKIFSEFKNFIPWSSLTLLAWNYYNVNIYYCFEIIEAKPILFIFGSYKTHKKTSITNPHFQELIQKQYLFPFFPIADDHLFLDKYQKYWNQIYQEKQQIDPKIIFAVPEHLVSVVASSIEILETFSYNNNYIYHLKQFDSFSGRKLQKKRNFLNFFKKNYQENIQTKTISSDDFPEIIEFVASFPQAGEFKKSLMYEANFLQSFLKHWNKEIMSGMIIKDKTNNKIIGFFIGCIKNSTTFEVFFQKTNHDYKGITSYILNLQAKTLPFELIDLQDDQGEDNIKKGKLAFFPKEVKKWMIILQK